MRLKILEKKYIDEKSEEYIAYERMILLKYNVSPIFLLISLVLLIGYWSNPKESDFLVLGSLCVLISLGSYYIGNRQNFFSFAAMLKANVTYNNETIQEINNLLQSRINSVLSCLKIGGWLFSFLIIDTVNDQVRQSLGLGSFMSLVAVFALILSFEVVALLLQRVVYSVTKLTSVIRHFVKSMANRGMFVSGYVTLSVIEKGLNELKQKAA